MSLEWQAYMKYFKGTRLSVNLKLVSVSHSLELDFQEGLLPARQCNNHGLMLRTGSLGGVY